MSNTRLGDRVELIQINELGPGTVSEPTPYTKWYPYIPQESICILWDNIRYPHPMWINKLLIRPLDNSSQT